MYHGVRDDHIAQCPETNKMGYQASLISVPVTRWLGGWTSRVPVHFTGIACRDMKWVTIR